jgi:TadE-like protein
MVRHVHCVRGTRQRGVAAVETALVTSLFLLPLTFGMTELGRAIYQYDALAKSARAAARYLAVRDNPANAAQYVLEARNVAVCGRPACGVGSVPVVPGLTIANVVAKLPDDDGGVRKYISTGYGSLDLVTITISPASAPYSFVSLVPFVVPQIAFGPISVTMSQVF